MPLPIAAAIAAAAIGPIIAAIGSAIAEGDEAKAQDLYQQALAEYGDVIKPKLDNAIAQEVGESAFASIAEDAALRDSQTASLGQLKEIADNAGMTQADEAMLQLANQGAQQQAGSDYQSLQQQLAARGQSGNPALMAAAMGNVNQNVVNATATSRYRAQADAMARRMRAIEAGAGIAGGIRSQDFDVAGTKANALDRVAFFNADKRTQADAANRQGAQDMFQNDLSVTDRENDERDKMARGYRGRAQRTRQTAGGIGNAVTTAGSAALKGGG